MSLHPDICAPKAIKDVGFFFDDRLYNKGMPFLTKAYEKHLGNEKIILHSNVNYIFFEKALQNIKKLDGNHKFILTLRNPVDRAISAYYFFKQRGLEEREIEEAFNGEEKILDDASLKELCDFTYKSHGLYAHQIKRFYNYFDKDQLLILFFDDIKNRPHQELSKAFRFLDIDETFKPELVHDNKTGTPSSKTAQKLIHGDNRLKNFIVRNVLDKIISLETKNKVKSRMSNWFVKQQVL